MDPREDGPRLRSLRDQALLISATSSTRHGTAMKSRRKSRHSSRDPQEHHPLNSPYAVVFVAWDRWLWNPWREVVRTEQGLSCLSVL